jgi:hypothetical protein
VSTLRRARTSHGDEARDRLLARAYGDGGLVVVVGVILHRAREKATHKAKQSMWTAIQGEAQGMCEKLNRRTVATGELTEKCL